MPALPASRSFDPLQSHQASLNFGDDVEGLIISCDGLESKNEICEARSIGVGGKERPASRTPGTLSIDPLEIELYVAKGDDYFEKWFKDVQSGQMKEATRDGSITMYDVIGGSVAEWEIYAAWPSKISYTDLDSASNDALKVTVTLVYEGFKRTK